MSQQKGVNQQIARAANRYAAAGGVVIRDVAGQVQVLLLERPARHEVRLPKGHIDTGETPRETAVREVAEESGFRQLHVLASLGTQRVVYEHQGQTYERTEHYFLMLRTGPANPDALPEAQFSPRWLPWEEAEHALTFAAEREWLRRARRVWERLAFAGKDDND